MPRTTYVSGVYRVPSPHAWVFITAHFVQMFSCYTHTHVLRIIYKEDICGKVFISMARTRMQSTPVYSLYTHTHGNILNFCNISGYARQQRVCAYMMMVVRCRRRRTVFRVRACGLFLNRIQFILICLNICGEKYLNIMRIYSGSGNKECLAAKIRYACFSIRTVLFCTATRKHAQ